MNKNIHPQPEQNIPNYTRRRIVAGVIGIGLSITALLGAKAGLDALSNKFHEQDVKELMDRTPAENDVCAEIVVGNEEALRAAEPFTKDASQRRAAARNILDIQEEDGSLFVDACLVDPNDPSKGSFIVPTDNVPSSQEIPSNEYQSMISG